MLFIFSLLGMITSGSVLVLLLTQEEKLGKEGFDIILFAILVFCVSVYFLGLTLKPIIEKIAKHRRQKKLKKIWA